MSDTKLATPQALQTVAANLFALSGGGLHISYSTSSINGQPNLTYQDPQRTTSFHGNDIRTVVVPDLGTVVSVTIVRTIDAGSTTFSLLIPQVTLTGQFDSVPVRTDGITTHHAFSIVPALNHGQRDFYSITPLSGTASHVLF